jgi:hypothetical protein
MTDHHNRSSLSSAKCLAAGATLALCSATATGQVWDVPGVTNNRGFHQNSGDRNMVRHNTRLYAAVVLQDGTVQIRRRADNTTPSSPWSLYVTAVNTASTGIGSTNPTTNVSMAVSATGHLHVTWGRYYYPSFFRQYYRCLEIGGTFTHPPQDITSLVGATSTTRTDSMAIAVGPKDFVYMSAQNGTQSWRSRLLQSAFVSYPTGVAPAWTDRGSIAGNAASSQNVSLAIDATGLVQMSFYNNTGNGQYATRVFQPAPVAWFAQEFIGTPPNPRDDDGYITTGLDGHTHVLYQHLVGIFGGVTRYELQYRRRIGTAAWSAPIVVYGFDSTDVGPNQSKGSYALAAGRRVFAIYREYDCGRLMVKQIKFGETSFKFLSEMRPSSAATNDYYMPSVRSTLWPQGNGLFQFLDVTFRRPTGATYQLFHQRLHVSEMDVDMTGCIGSYGEPQITFGGVPASTEPRTIEIGVQQANPSAPALLLWTLDPYFAVPFGCGTLYANSPFWPVLTVNACGTAKHIVPLLPGGYSTTLYFQWAVSDSGWKLSNRGSLRL